jgi:hypothetical protein
VPFIVNAAQTGPGGTSYGGNTTLSMTDFNQIDLGFDVQSVPQDWQTMQAGWNYSPFYDVGLYIGGVNYTGTKAGTVANPLWLGLVQREGWGIFPIWVGWQPVCTPTKVNGSHVFNVYQGTNGSLSASEGAGDATSAANNADQFNLSNSVIFADIEQYTPPQASPYNPGNTCSAPVVNYINAWVSTLHQRRYSAGIYVNQSDLQDIIIGGAFNPAITNMPDELYVAKQNYLSINSTGAEQYALSSTQPSPLPPLLFPLSPTANPNITSYGADSNNSFKTEDRIHQFMGPQGSVAVPTSYGPYNVWNGEVINSGSGGTDSGIDWDAEYAPVVPWVSPERALPAPFNLSPADGNTTAAYMGAVRFSWSPIPAAYYGGPTPVNSNARNIQSYTVAISTNESALPTADYDVCAAALGCTAYGTNAAFIDIPSATFSPTTQYFWTVSVNGVYKPGAWADSQSFTCGCSNTQLGSGSGTGSGSGPR